MSEYDVEHIMNMENTNYVPKTQKATFTKGKTVTISVLLFLYCIKLYKLFPIQICKNIVSERERRDATKIKCKPTGNRNCNPGTWTAYTNGCCTEQEKCAINEGDCNLHTECQGSLVCEPDSCPTSENQTRQFHPRASCCQLPRGEFIPGKG